MKQQILTAFEKHMNTTRRAQFLRNMARIVPWLELTGLVAAVNPNGSGIGGRPPVEVDKPLRKVVNEPVHANGIWIGHGTLDHARMVSAPNLTMR